MEDADARSARPTKMALYGLGGFLVLAVLPLGRWIVPSDSLSGMLGREVIWWCIACAVVLWLTRVERLPVRSIGLRRPTWKSVGYGVLAALAVTAMMAAQFAVVLPLFHLSSAAVMAQQQAILRTPYWYRFLLVLRAAVVEEVVFRGYVIEKVRQLSGSGTLAVLVSVAAFTLSHLRGWGAVQLIPVAASGTILALFYVWRRDLSSNILGHFLTDALAFLTH